MGFGMPRQYPLEEGEHAGDTDDDVMMIDEVKSSLALITLDHLHCLHRTCHVIDSCQVDVKRGGKKELDRLGSRSRRSRSRSRSKKSKRRRSKSRSRSRDRSRRKRSRSREGGYREREREEEEKKRQAKEADQVRGEDGGRGKEE